MLLRTHDVAEHGYEPTTVCECSSTQQALAVALIGALLKLAHMTVAHRVGESAPVAGHGFVWKIRTLAACTSIVQGALHFGLYSPVNSQTRH